MSFFGKNIKFLRGTRNLSQTALAELLGLKRAVIGAYEEERAEPKVEIFVKVAKLFNVELESLICADMQASGISEASGMRPAGIPLINSANSAEFAAAARAGTSFVSADTLNVPGIISEGLVAAELNGEILILRPEPDSLQAASANAVVLTDRGFVLPQQAAFADIIRTYSIQYVIKRYASPDQHDTILRAIFNELRNPNYELRMRNL